jgi:hypothetical protein
MANISWWNNLNPDYGAQRANLQAAGLQKKQQPVRRKETKPPFLYADKTRLAGSCGIGLLYNFRKLEHEEFFYAYGKNLEDLNNNNPGGCGFMVAAFIDTPECKEMYLKLKDEFPILYTSPIRFNVNSYHNFFFCIFDTGERDPKFEEYHNEEEIYAHAGFKNGLEW